MLLNRECRLTRRDARRRGRRGHEGRCTPTEEPSTGRSRSHGRRRGRTRQYSTPAWKRNPQLTGPRATRGSEDRATKGLKVMQYWRLPATECADKAVPRNHHSRKTLTTGKPRPHSRMTEASALEGQPRRGREYADMQVSVSIHARPRPERLPPEQQHACLFQSTYPSRGTTRRGAAIIIASCFPAGKCQIQAASTASLLPAHRRLPAGSARRRHYVIQFTYLFINGLPFRYHRCNILIRQQMKRCLRSRYE